MAIDDFYVCRSRRCVRPRKANSPLLVDPDRKLSQTISFERFQTIPSQAREVGKTYRGFENA